MRLRQNGTLDNIRRPDAVEREIQAIYARAAETPDPSHCWEWPGSLNARGYGARKESGEHLAHRITWVIANGPIPEGLFVCHICDNPPCVNPAHLFLGSHRDNMRDMARKGRAIGGTPYKLTASDVREMRDLRAHGWSFRQIGAAYGVSGHYVGAICAGRRWTEVA
jgi:hypothetical protein